MSLVFIIAIAVSLLMPLYLGRRLQTWFAFKLTGIGRFLYWIAILFACSLFIVSRMLSHFSTYWLPLLGNIIFAIVICSIYVLFVFDIIRLLSFKLFKPSLFTKVVYVICVIGLCAFGYTMAMSPAIVYYKVNIDKSSKVEHLRLVQVSDIHLSEVTPQKFIEQMVTDVNQLNADFIFVTGDVIDNRLKPFIDKGFNHRFQNLESKYGTYVIFGNHEYLNVDGENNSEEDIIKAYQAANMHVLKDDVLYNANLGITLIGRDDISVKNHGIERASLSDLLTFSDLNTPIILLDHQPKNLNEPAMLGADLMISGHTHQGQIFPFNVLVDYIYENGYGLYQNLPYHFTSIVSSGYGLWGPPIRLLTRAEIVVIDVTFHNSNTPSSN